MHDDPTRMMGRPDGPEHRSHGNTRLLVAGLIAVIVGLVIAIAVIAGGDGDEETVSTPSEVTTLPTTAETTETTEADTTETTEADTTAPAEEEEDEGTEGEAEESEEELEDGSGGIEVP